MVGQSKILGISRNYPHDSAAAQTVQETEDMATALRVGEPESLIENEPRESIGADNGIDWSGDAVGDWSEDAQTPSRPWARILAGVALGLTAAGWTGFWVWAHVNEFAAPFAPARIAELVASWAMPVALLAICWLLIMRSSSAEARRFADVAAQLRSESEALEQRMRTVNGEIALARSFLAENARELEAIGRTSATRLTNIADTLVTALSDTDQKAQLLERVSSAAVTNVELLRDHLPVVTSAAKDATNQIGNAGMAAHDQVKSLSAAMREMDEAAKATAQSMDELGMQAQTTCSNIEAVTGTAATILRETATDAEDRFAAMLEKLAYDTGNVHGQISEAAKTLNDLTTDNGALLDEQAQRLRAMVELIGEATGNQERRIAAMVGQLDTSLADSHSRIGEAGAEAAATLEKLAGQLSTLLENSDQRLKAIGSNATDRIAKIAFAINALSESSSELAVNLSGNEERAATMLADAGKLLKELQSASDELGIRLPSGFAALEQQWGASNDALLQLRGESEALDTQASALAQRLSEIGDLLESHRALFGTLSEQSDTALVTKRAEIDRLAASLNATNALIADVSQTAQEQLEGPLYQVAEAAKQAAENSQTIIETELAGFSAKLAERNLVALKQAIDAQLSGLDEAVNQAISRNFTLSDEAASRINRQLQEISQLTANLEQRAAAARENFEGIDDEAFARRIALLTESLNSAAIDVAKILSNEVTDTAWAAYLKGDRGVFTRRAVRLLDSGEARIIANHYDDDAEFRDHVNRYIHDFEAMMRVLLSTRDGNAIGVTLLSSDVGKLYVALAQAIDRLRG